MKNFKNIREQLGLNHSEMAAMLGTSRVTYTRAEKGTRNLPHSAALALGDIQKKLAQVKRSKKEIACRCNKDFKRHFENHSKDIQIKLHELNRELEQLQSDYERNQCLGKLIPRLCTKENTPWYVTGLNIKVNKKLSKCSATARQILQFHIQLLENELEIVSETIGKPSDPVIINNNKNK